MRRLVGESLCVAQAVRHVDQASLEEVYAARMHRAITGIAAHRKDLYESGPVLQSSSLSTLTPQNESVILPLEPASQLISA